MKKITALIFALILTLGLVGCNGKTVNIDFPFEVEDVESVEMYHYNGAPASAEKKVVVAESDIKTLYDKCYIWAVSALYPILPQYRHNLSVGIHRIPECHAQFCPAKKRVCSIYNSCYFRTDYCAFLGKLHREYRTIHSMGRATTRLFQKAPIF